MTYFCMPEKNEQEQESKKKEKKIMKKIQV